MLEDSSDYVNEEERINWSSQVALFEGGVYFTPIQRNCAEVSLETRDLQGIPHKCMLALSSLFALRRGTACVVKQLDHIRF